jgi:cbb3-type cytochrome oxidase maturation protein
MIWCIGSSLIMGVAGIVIYVYYLRKGQFDDPEDVKYQMFRDEEKDGKQE